MTTLVNIRCREIAGLTISREACGAQVTRPYAPAVCRTCPVGMAHARGETATCWPDGKRVEERVHEVDRVAARSSWKPPAAPKYAPQQHKPRARKLSEAPMPTKRKPRPTGVYGRRYTYAGRELTAVELAALPEAVVSLGAVRNRLAEGWSPERAVTQPLDVTRSRRRSE